MIQEPYLKEVFAKPPIVSFQRPKNLRDLLIHAKLPQNDYRTEKLDKGNQDSSIV